VKCSGPAAVTPGVSTAITLAEIGSPHTLNYSSTHYTIHVAGVLALVILPRFLRASALGNGTGMDGTQLTR